MEQLTPEQELAKVRKALADANAEAKAYREEKEALQAQLEAATSWKDRALKAEVRAALKEQGVKDPARVLKVMDLDGVELDDEGKLSNLDTKIAGAKKEWPELFDRKKEVANGADIFTQGETPKQKTGTEAQVARLFARQ